MQNAHAGSSYLPKRLPKYLDTPQIRTALDHWSQLQTKDDRNVNEFLHIYEKKIRGQTWAFVYCHLRFNIVDEELDVAKLEKEIHRTFENYNKSASKIRVLFVPYVDLYKFENFAKSLGIQMDWNSAKQLKVLKIRVLHSRDPIWREKEQLDDSFARNTSTGKSITTKNATYITCDLWPLTHELTHLILRSADAYKVWGDYSDEDRKVLEPLINAGTASAFDVEPIEIYIALKRMGYEALGWNEYVDRTYMVSCWLDRLIIHHTSLEQIDKSTFRIYIFDWEGNQIFNNVYFHGYQKLLYGNILPENFETIPDYLMFGPGFYTIETELFENLALPDVFTVLGKSQKFDHRYSGQTKLMIY